VDEFLDGIGFESRMMELGSWQKWAGLPYSGMLLN